jgi:SAM-dependent methyltransferase
MIEDTVSKLIMPDAPTLLSGFESIGDNCEFGYVQRNYGAERGGLLRWAISAPDSLTIGLKDRFARLYEYDQLLPVADGMVIDRFYGFHFHSRMRSHVVDGERRFIAGEEERRAIYSDEFEKVQFLKNRLLALLEQADKLLVFKRNFLVPDELAAKIRDLLFAYNPRNVLLLVGTYDKAPGTVWHVGPGLLKASIDRFAPYYKAEDSFYERWLEICRKAYALAAEGVASSPRLDTPEPADGTSGGADAATLVSKEVPEETKPQSGPDILVNDRLSALAAYSGDPWQPSNPYFSRAEKDMAWLWKNVVFPFIEDCDFSESLDLAAGHGRNSPSLLERAKRLYITDIVPGNVEACRKRFADREEVTCFVNNGFDFRPMEDESLTFIYCFDAMVHFDSDVVRSYLRDAKRVLKPGGRAFLHHSNYTGGHDWRTNRCARNFMSKELFEHYALKEGLQIVRQKPINWAGVVDIDCLSLVSKPE